MGLEQVRDSGAVDPAFVQDPEHRTPVVAEARSIPLIDLSAFLLHRQQAPDDDEVAVVPPSLRELVAEVEDACREWGFFQVVNHGVPDEVVERAWAASRGFFVLPEEERLRVKRSDVNPMGYYDGEHTKNVRDWKEVFDFVAQERVALSVSDGSPGGVAELLNQWPQHPPGFREACEEFARVLMDLAFKLLELIALSLGLPSKRLHGFFKDQTSLLRLNHYPPCPYPHLALGVGRHKDPGALTILVQDDVGGLDVKRRSDGQWVRVKPIPRSFIINIGDIIQVWSNDKYESAEHRVSVNTERERFSIPLIFNPSHYVMVKPLEELVDGEETPANYDEYNWGEFLKSRVDGNFKKLDVENIQVSHFRKPRPK